MVLAHSEAPIENTCRRSYKELPACNMLMKPDLCITIIVTEILNSQSKLIQIFTTVYHITLFCNPKVIPDDDYSIVESQKQIL